MSDTMQMEAALDGPVLLVYAANNTLIPHFPEGMLCLAGALRDAEIPRRLLDAALVSEEDWHFDDNPRLLAISVYTNETLNIALKIAAKFRAQFPDRKIIWGGPHCHLAQEETAEHPLVDAVAYKEGEGVIVTLAEQAARGEWDPASVRGLIYKDGDNIATTEPPEPLKADEFPWPDYELLDMKLYSLSSRKFYYQTSRGCPALCTFCNIRYNIKKWRGKSADRVTKELDMVVDRFDPEEIYISDSNFFPDLKRSRAICEAIIERGYKFKWSAFCRVDTIQRMDNDFIKLLRKAGCYKLDIGGESGSDEMLKHLAKGTTREMTIDSVRKIYEEGILPELSFMTGLPFETEEDTQLTLSLIAELRERFPGLTVNGVFHYQPYPDTSLGKQVIAEYNLPIPYGLDEWAKYPITLPRRVYFPWMNNTAYARMRTIGAVTSYLHLYHILIADGRWGGPGGLGTKTLALVARIAHFFLLRPSIGLRLGRGQYAFPVEWRLYETLRNKTLKMV